jgi:DNA-binding GntR family transcriptional regulator
MTSELLENSGQLGVEPRPSMRIAYLVRRRICGGELKPGDTVTLASLAEEWGVGRQTVAKGFRLLVEEGLLKRWPGYGYIVQHSNSQPT